MTLCPTCHGRGAVWVRWMDIRICPECKGTGRGCFEVTWSYATDPGRLETSQVDAPNADEAVRVVRDGDDGYGQVGRIVRVVRRA